MSKGLLDHAVMRTITAAEAKQIEKQLAVNPDDIVARFDLINFLWRNQWLGKNAPRYQKLHARQVLWVIRNAPESAGPFWAQFSIEQRTAPEGFRRASRAWLKQVRKHPQNAEVLWNATNFFTSSNRKVAERIAKLGAELEPQNAGWLKRLGQIYSLGRWNKSLTKTRPDPKRSLACYEAASKLDGSEADEHLAIDLAKASYKAAEFEKAASYAGTLARWKIDHESARGGNDAVHHGNTLLGRLALRTGDIASAKRHLLASGDVSGSPVLGSFGPTMVLAKELVELGEQETVLQYFDLCAKFWSYRPKDLKAWAKQVKRGKIPDFRASLRR